MTKKNESIWFNAGQNKWKYWWKPDRDQQECDGHLKTEQVEGSEINEQRSWR